MSDISTDTATVKSGDDRLRTVAIERVKAQRDVMTHLFTYAVVKLGLWAVWIVGGITDEWVFPWPALVMVIRGLFVLRQWYQVYRRDPLREDLVQREIEQLRPASGDRPLTSFDIDDS